MKKLSVLNGIEPDLTYDIENNNEKKTSVITKAIDEISNEDLK